MVCSEVMLGGVEKCGVECYEVDWCGMVFVGME